MRKVWNLLLILSLVPLYPAYAVKAPEWVETLRKTPVPDWARKADLVIYLNERKVDVSKSGRRYRVRKAAKPLTGRGLDVSTLLAQQEINQEFIFIGAWKIQPDGAVRKFNHQDVVQYDADGRYNFSMSKINVLEPSGVQVGDLVAWEFLLKSKPEAHTQTWWFASNYPTLVSRFGIQLPQGWKFRVKMLNHEEWAPRVDDQGYTFWEMRDQAGIDTEPMGVPFRDLVPSLLVSYGPGSGKADDREFNSWNSLATWYGAIVRSQVVSDGTIREAVSRILPGSSTGQLDRIRGITEFVQGVRYLDVAVGRSVAEPHPAPQILKNRYGDCEDKSVLTITLLKEIGVEAYPVIALTNNMGSVIPDFPSPTQFNHLIVGIQGSPRTDLPSATDVEGVGRLIFFDPTDPATGLGDLPSSLQGTQALVVHDKSESLVTLPVLPPGSNRREARIRVSFAPNGEIDVNASMTYTGGYASRMRAYYEAVRGEKRKQEYLEFLQSRYGRAEVRKMEVSGVEKPNHPIVRNLEVRMSLPGKDLGGLKTMETQFLLGSRARTLPDGERKTPLRIDAGYEERDRTIIEVQPGWRVLGLPETRKASGPVGEYELTVLEEKGTVVIDRRLTVQGTTVPPSEYPAVREFFQTVERGDSFGIAFEKTAEGA